MTFKWERMRACYNGFFQDSCKSSTPQIEQPQGKPVKPETMEKLRKLRERLQSELDEKDRLMEEIALKNKAKGITLSDAHTSP